MKKLSALAFVLLSGAGAANSQEAFKHLSIGLEAATTGIGLELALPIVSDHLVLAAGYNYGNATFNVKGNSTLNVSELSGRINQYIDNANNFLALIPEEPARLENMPSSMKLHGDAAFRLSTAKVVLEYYPAKKSNFHINAGVFIGNADTFSMDADCHDFWSLYNANSLTAKKMAGKYPEFAASIGEIPELKETINGRTFELKAPGIVNIGLQAATVRPYLGLGFGRSVPNTHVGFQFDLGALYIGKLAISSANEINGASNVSVTNKGIQKIVEIAEKICVYPQISFRLIYRIF